jgi:hypothetical protein
MNESTLYRLITLFGLIHSVKKAGDPHLNLTSSLLKLEGLITSANTPTL